MRLEQRFWPYTDNDLTYYKKLIRLIKKHKGSCDAVWFCLPHGAIKKADHEKHISAIKPIADELRKAGIGVSLQCGNFDVEWMNYYGFELYNDIYEGDQTDGKYCWRNQTFLKYTEEIIELYTRELKPDVLWPDDDLRIRSWGKPLRCVCPSCMSKFNNLYGYDFDDNSIFKAMEKDLELRDRFIEFSESGLVEYARRLAVAALKGNPDTIMGQQHGDFSGKTFVRVLEAYKDAGSKAVYSRSGAGAYSDRHPLEILGKVRQTEWQLSKLPNFVTEHCPEVENYPHTYYSKTAYGTCLEASLQIAQGFNFLSFSAIPRRQDCLSISEQMFKQMSKHRSYWDYLEKKNRGTKRIGAQIFVPENYWNKQGKNWLDINPCFTFTERTTAFPVANIGLPITYSCQDNPVYLLDGRYAECLSKAEVEHLASKPVITDGETLEILSRRGFSKLLSASAKRYGEGGVHWETIPGILFTNHKINEGLAVQGFEDIVLEQSSFYLEGDVEPLSMYGTRGLLGCTKSSYMEPNYIGDALINTKEGGKWIVFGYSAWSVTMSYERRKQFFNAYEYIGGKLSALVEEANRAELFPRANISGQIVNVTILNASIEKSEKLWLRIDKPAGDKAIYLDAERTVKLKVKKENNFLYALLPEMNGWAVGTVFLD